MKITSVIPLFLAVATPLVSAASLKGAQVNRQLFIDPNAGSQFAGRNEVPTLDELIATYENYCTLCATIKDIVDFFNNQDFQYCDLCNIEVPTLPEIPALPSDGCFSASSTVQTPQGTVPMKNVAVGDNVLTAGGSFEPVYAWGHKNAAKTAEFLQFNGALEMTAEHLVFLEGKVNPVRADSIKIGDSLQGAEVKSIKKVKREGLYTPLTPSGTVVVNGITASSYISLQENAKEYVELQGGLAIMSYQDFVHMALSPFRLLTMGISSKLGNSYNEEGIPTYASLGIDLARWAEGLNIALQGVFFLAFLVVAGASMVIENTFGPAMAPLVVATGAGVYAYMQKNNLSIRAKKVKSV